jgi:hypothetical protein
MIFERLLNAIWRARLLQQLAMCIDQTGSTMTKMMTLQFVGDCYLRLFIVILITFCQTKVRIIIRYKSNDNWMMLYKSYILEYMLFNLLIIEVIIYSLRSVSYILTSKWLVRNILLMTNLTVYYYFIVLTSNYTRITV